MCMVEKFSGSVESTEVFLPSPSRVTPVGLLLWPRDTWARTIIVGQSIKIVLPNGREFFSKVRGGEIMTGESAGMLIEPIPEVDNMIPPGTQVYVLTEDD